MPNASSSTAGGQPNQAALSVGPQYDRPTPAWVGNALRKFGSNPYGGPLYRVVWSETRLEQCGGYYEDVQKAEYRWQPRYPDTKRWMLEKWLPTSYSREQWYRQFSDPSGACYLGPYLEHGDYHCCYRLEYRGEFMPLTLAVVEYYTRLIEAGRESTALQRKFAIEQREAKIKREWENRCDSIIDDSQPAFGVTRLMSSMRGRKSADRVKPEDVSFASAESLPSWVPRTPGFRQV